MSDETTASLNAQSSQVLETLLDGVNTKRKLLEAEVLLLTIVRGNPDLKIQFSDFEWAQVPENRTSVNLLIEPESEDNQETMVLKLITTEERERMEALDEERGTV